MVFKRVFAATSLIIMLLSAGFLAGYIARDILVAGDSKFPILVEAYNILQKNGINEIPPAPRMEYGMIHGMVQAYDDPYTLFVEPVQHELESNNLQGSFGGIGVALERDSIAQVVLNPFPGSPAFEAGVLEGDILLMVNNEVLSPDISIDTITAWLRGPVGEKVEIVISRGDARNQHEFAISRVEFPLPSVTWHLDFEEPGIGLITINIIAASTKDELIKAVEDLKSRGASAFILDLRENSGGLLTAGIDIARLFLEKGVVIEQKYRNKSVETYYVEKPGPYIDFPLVVVINHNTASAAEIIAGAVKRQDRAVVVGSPSMGKDSIQLVFELKDGSSLHVTAANWWIPGLQPVLGEVGLQPDVTIADHDPLSEYDVAIAEARKILKQQLTP